MPVPPSIPTASSGYSKLHASDDEAGEQLLPSPLAPVRAANTVWHNTLKGLLILNMVLLFASSVLLGLSIHKGFNTMELAPYSPALKAVKYETVTFNGSFMYPSEYRGSPSSDVDSPWMRVTMNIKPFRLLEEDRVKAGIKASRSLVKFMPEDGGGYMAAIESNHQLHCLNMIRKYTYREYYESRDEMFEAKPIELRGHIDHCIEMLRQRIMCTADIRVITFHWVHGWRSPYPNFNTEHMCRNFEKIIDWNYERAVHIDESHVTRFGDAEDLPVPP